jgi:hypothetical protein
MRKLRNEGLVFLLVLIGLIGFYTGCNTNNTTGYTPGKTGPPAEGAIQLTNNPADINPRWSPQADRIAFERNHNIYKIDVESGAVYFLAENGRCPAWSVDGRYIAFVRNGEIYRVHDIQERPVIKMTEGAYASDICGLDWGMNSVVVYFEPGDSISRQFRLVSFDLNSHERRYLTRADIGYSELPRWSPHGEYCLFSTSELGICIFDVEKDNYYSVVYWGSPMKPCWFDFKDTLRVLFTENGSLHKINPDGSERATVLFNDFYPKSMDYTERRRQLVMSYNGIWILDFPPR